MVCAYTCPMHCPLLDYGMMLPATRVLAYGQRCAGCGTDVGCGVVWCGGGGVCVCAAELIFYSDWLLSNNKEGVLRAVTGACVYACVFMCVCVCACVRACVCLCVRCRDT
eukprot:3531979-Rhodomonas_salina.1